MPYDKVAERISRWGCFDHWYLSSLLDFDRVHVYRWIAVLVDLPTPFPVAPSRLDYPSLLISGLPLPASLQAPVKLEAWEYVSFRVDDDRIQR